MKIFEEIEWTDGGPNDKGSVIGYHYGESESQLKNKYGITHNFISFREITTEEYNKRLQAKQRELDSLKIK